jgi:hypothetical protein
VPSLSRCKDEYLDFETEYNRVIRPSRRMRCLYLGRESQKTEAGYSLTAYTLSEAVSTPPIPFV